MSTEEIWQTHSISSDVTETIAEHIGQRLRGGEVLELVSDLGGGKTTFTRGLARGAGSQDKVASPSFTIMREYQAPVFTIVHFDFYRLSDAGVITEELREVVDDPHMVVVVEWSDIVSDILPDKRVRVQIMVEADGGRTLRCTYAPHLGYLFAGLST